jgi:hypothetical protein
LAFEAAVLLSSSPCSFNCHGKKVHNPQKFLRTNKGDGINELVKIDLKN